MSKYHSGKALLSKVTSRSSHREDNRKDRLCLQDKACPTCRQHSPCMQIRLLLRALRQVDMGTMLRIMYRKGKCSQPGRSPGQQLHRHSNFQQGSKYRSCMKFALCQLHKCQGGRGTWCKSKTSPMLSNSSPKGM